MLSERRSGPSRDRCEIQAFIETGSLAERQECIVENLTEDGAKLKFGHPVALPTYFRLLIPVLDDICDEKAVELRWSSGAEVGVRFVLAFDAGR